jgi:Rad3-related DNA helicase
VARDLKRTARETFGWKRLRPGQLEAMTAVMDGQDVLAVMPTGSGKSAVYQVPALLLDGPTVVVSPLISLQRDQVASLLERGEAAAAVQANSSLSEREQDAAFDALRAGQAEFLFLAPEQLSKPEVLDAVAAPSRRCSSSTRRTASARGGTTSAPTTCACTPRSSGSAGRACWRSRPPPHRRSATRSCGGCGSRSRRSS